eukprot:g3546.t1
MRVFINDVGNFISGAIASKFAQDEDCEIVGTLCSGDRKPTYVGECANATQRKDVESLMFTADVIVWNLHSGQYKQTRSAIRTLNRKVIEEGTKTLIIVSKSNVFDNTPVPATPEEGEEFQGFSEKDYRSRVPPAHLLELKSIESQALSARSESLRVVVVAAGSIYGKGEADFHYIFRKGWMNHDGENIPIPSVHEKEFVPGKEEEAGEEEDEGKETGEDGAEGKELDGYGKPYYTNGHNVIPTIHVDDLASIIQAVSSSPPEDQDYILALDNGTDTLREIVEAASKSLCNGDVSDLNDEETADFHVQDEEFSNASKMLECNTKFNMSDSYISGLEFEWVAQDGPVAVMDTIVKEFIKARNLTPVQILFVSPPDSNDTAKSLAFDLARTYDITVLSPSNLLRFTLGQASGEVGSEISELKAEAQALKDADNEDNPEPSLLAKMLRLQWNSSQRIQKRGFILTGRPTTLQAAEACFLKTNGEDDEGDDAAAEGEDENAAPANLEKFTPNKVIQFICEDDDFLMNKCETDTDREVMKTQIDAFRLANAFGKAKPNGDNADGDNAESKDGEEKEGGDEGKQSEGGSAESKEAKDEETEEGQNADGAPDAEESIPTTLSFFTTKAKLETLYQAIGPGMELDDIARDLQTYINGGSKPFNYHPTREEVRAAREKKEREERERIAREAKEKAEAEKKAAEEKAAREAKFEQLQKELKRKEEQQLEANTKPLRSYLMDNIVPLLTEGLVETIKVEPDDPIDFLAEWLFRNAPEDERINIEMEDDGKK